MRPHLKPRKVEPLAHPGSPTLVECIRPGLRDLYGLDNPEDRAETCRWAQHQLTVRGFIL